GVREALRYPAVGAAGAVLNARPVPEVGAVAARRLLLRGLHDVEAGWWMPAAEAAAAAAQHLAIVRRLGTAQRPAARRFAGRAALAPVDRPVGDVDRAVAARAQLE